MLLFAPFVALRGIPQSSKGVVVQLVRIPACHAGVIVGGVVVFFAAILLMVIAQQSRAVPLKSNNLPEQTADDPTAQLGTVIGDIVAKSNVKSSDFVLTALIAGIVLGASPSLRQRILTTLSDMTKSTDK